ncbi:antibiotic biosynthesis monooxygenase family protein [Streptacidiphilus jiangxiensis]|uniref:antibiotic biosynthesis monooxygenase family protein n=1 Tax=Streptacidiphilus jiangxiensis TaxID=235985 RepID=UPI0011602ED0|nr:hypothetical protein [Streptacidiphilus jiangxiensis]
MLAEANVRVPAGREADLIAAYHRLIAQPLPDGLLQTELLRGPDGRWRIQTLWQDRSFLNAMRERPAHGLLHGLHADADFAVFEVVDEWITPQPEDLQ